MKTRAEFKRALLMQGKPNHLCPRCGGTEMYLGHSERTTGLGGIYGRKTHQIRIPLCKACTAQMDVTWANGENPYIQFIKAFSIVLVVFLVSFNILVIGGIYLSSLMDISWPCVPLIC